MTRRAWVRLDNASNIFLAARSDADPKVFRLSADLLEHDVDPELLQEALDTTYDRYPLYHAVLRRGVFWYYLQDSDLHPVVTAEHEPTCAPIYQADRRSLLFRVLYHRRRIVLEVFHALSDGTGALWFLSDLISAYVRLRYPEDGPPDEGADPVGAAPGREERGGMRIRPGAERAPEDTAGQPHGLTTDSFAHYFRRRRATAPGPAFTREATPAPLTVEEAALPSSGGAAAPGRTPRPAGTKADHVKKVHRVRGSRAPDNRTRAVELTMPVKDVLALARAEGAALTMYLTALFFESVRLSSGGLDDSRTLSASVPVNLRQFFPSTSARNFFATVRVEHTYGEGPDDLGSICRQLEGQFRPKATPESLERKLRTFIRFERMPALRIVPRPLKDVILGLVNRASNRGLSVAVSNLGRAGLPEPAGSHVRRVLFQVSAARPQFCAISHGDLLTVSFTSPFTETDHIREFARLLTSRGVDVTVAAARVTEAELTGTAPTEDELAEDEFAEGELTEGESAEAGR
ncbi:alcohol acetyltransferase [Kocuria coralli]|uniref:Alcohol acetyltransferase n=1 Tax=Kocuria coralli TaxID=1461025 RepID=A0A5J5KUF7_9MICC|nr:alcohol acetyltransferase [Kocuria coralli]KAA9393204.1 alcohol acetyltransferase [Kocuria coralli]